MSAAEETTLYDRYRSTRLVIRLLITGVLVYMVVAYFVSASSPPRPEAESSPRLLRPVLYGVGGMLGIGVIIWRRLVFRNSRLIRLVDAGGLKRLVQELASKSIALAALSEAIAVVGLALSLMIRSFEPMLHLGIIALILLLYNMPRRSAWERTVRNFSPRVYEEL